MYGMSGSSSKILIKYYYQLNSIVTVLHEADRRGDISNYKFNFNSYTLFICMGSNHDRDEEINLLNGK